MSLQSIGLWLQPTGLWRTFSFIILFWFFFLFAFFSESSTICFAVCLFAFFSESSTICFAVCLFAFFSESSTICFAVCLFTIAHQCAMHKRYLKDGAKVLLLGGMIVVVFTTFNISAQLSANTSYNFVLNLFAYIKKKLYFCSRKR